MGEIQQFWEPGLGQPPQGLLFSSFSEYLCKDGEQREGTDHKTQTCIESAQAVMSCTAEKKNPGILGLNHIANRSTPRGNQVSQIGNRTTVSRVHSVYRIMQPAERVHVNVQFPPNVFGGKNDGMLTAQKREVLCPPGQSRRAPACLYNKPLIYCQYTEAHVSLGPRKGTPEEQGRLPPVQAA